MAGAEAELEAFHQALHADARAGFAGADVATGATLAAQLASGRAAWPTFAVARARFAAEIARRLGPGATPERLAAACAEDLYLAIAGADGNTAAQAELDRQVVAEIDRSASRLRATPDQAAEARSVVRKIMLASEPGRPAAVSQFSGRGDLRGYVRVIATRELVKLINQGRREVVIGEAAMFDALVPAADPELSYLRAKYRGHVDAALRAALVALDDRSRALLRYSLVDGWSVDKIGELYGVHRATAARWVSAARDALGAQIRTELARGLSIDVAEVDSIVRLVQSRVDMSLDRLLDPAVVPTQASD